MKSFLRLGLACLVTVTLAWAPAAWTKEPDFPPPPRAAIELVSKSIIVDNRPTQIRQFYTRDKMEKVNKFYRRLWSENEDGEEPGYVETDAMPPWHIITRVEDDHLMTVQIQKADDGGSWGYLARSELHSNTPGQAQSSDIPSMRESQVLHQLKSVDAGQKGDTLMLVNKYSLNSNVDFYKHYYEGRGWRENMDSAIRKAKSHVLSYTNNRHTVHIVLTGDNKSTRIVVNRVVHDLL